MQHGEPTGSYSASPTSTPEQMAGRIQRAEAQDQAQQASERAVEKVIQRRQDIENEFAEAQGLVGQFDPYDFDNEAIEEEVAGPDIDDDDATVTNNNNALTSDSSPGKKRRVLTDEEVSAFQLKKDPANTPTNEPIVHDADPELQFQKFVDVPGRQELTGRQTPRREDGNDNNDGYDYTSDASGEIYRKAAGLDSNKPKPEKEDEE